MFDEESQKIRAQQKFLQDVEHSIQDANRTVIHQRVPRLDKARFVEFATRVAKLRAEYLEAGLALADGGGDLSLDALKLRREAYEEGRDAFAALERAIERGYVDIDES